MIRGRAGFRLALWMGTAASALSCGAAVVDADALERLRLPTVPPPSHLALLVGIDEYSPAAGTRRPDSLAGAKRDVELARALLIERFGFPSESIRVRTDAEATHQQIVADWKEWLIDRAGENTEVVFWFSGHGSRCPDAAGGRGGEVAAADSTLATYDSRIPPDYSSDGTLVARGGFDFTDDELHSLLRALATRTLRITVITDACHSGGVTRGGPRVRFTGDFDRPLAHSDIADFWPEDVPFLEDADPARSAPAPWVHIAACAFDQSAVEYVATANDGSRLTNGALTVFLTYALRSAASGETWRSLARRVALDVSNFHREQQVQAEGPLDRELFGGRVRRAPGFGAWVGPASRAIDIDAGMLQSMAPGQRLAIVLEDGRSLGEAIVTEVTPATAIALFEGEPPSVAEVTPARALPLTTPGAPKIGLHLPSGVPFDALAAALATPAAGGAEGGGDVTAIEVERNSDGAAPLELREHDGGFELQVRPTGPILARFGALPEPTALRALAANESRYRALLALGTRVGTYRVEAKLELAAPFAAQLCTDSSSGCTRIVDDPAADEQVDLVVTLDPATSAAPLWLTVLLIGEDRTIERLVPAADGARDAILFPGEAVRVPLLLEPTRVEGLARNGIDRFLILATEDYADFSPFLAPNGTFLPAEATTEVVATRGGRGWPTVLKRALQPTVTRSASTPAATDDSSGSAPFGIAVLDLQLLTARPSAAPDGNRADGER